MNIRKKLTEQMNFLGLGEFKITCFIYNVIYIRDEGSSELRIIKPLLQEIKPWER